MITTPIFELEQMFCNAGYSVRKNYIDNHVSMVEENGFMSWLFGKKMLLAFSYTETTTSKYIILTYQKATDIHKLKLLLDTFSRNHPDIILVS